MRLTMPQILMMNHAAHVNRRRMDLKTKNPRNVLDSVEAGLHQEERVWGGKKFSELTSEEMMLWIRQE